MNLADRFETTNDGLILEKRKELGLYDKWPLKKCRGEAVTTVIVSDPRYVRWAVGADAVALSAEAETLLEEAEAICNEIGDPDIS